MNEPPQVLRIKRKRGQDPLQALILEHRNPKRSKPSSPISSPISSPAPEPRSWYFQLARTDNAAVDHEILASVLAEAAKKEDNNRQFVLPKQQTEEDTVIPNELADMVDSFLHVNEVGERQKRRGGATTKAQVQSTEDLASEYVFDVYKLSDTEPLTNANFPLSLIGYIRFFDDDEYDLMQSDDDKSEVVFSDDEDSNAESFYQNDYPEDEDAGAFSDTFDDVVPVILESSEAAEGHAYLRGDEQGEYDDLYEELFEDGEKRINFLEDENDENEQFQRQNFFPGDHDDPLAIHRDRIFGKLQNMIDEDT